MLDMARANLGLKGVVSFHGVLDKPKGSPEDSDSPHIAAKVQVLHGYEDPMVSPEMVECIKIFIHIGRYDEQWADELISHGRIALDACTHHGVFFD